MRRLTWLAAGTVATALTGCVSYPVYQPVPVARLTPAQSAALTGQPLTQADRDRFAAADAQVLREDQADQNAQRQAQVLQPYAYAYPAYPGYPSYSYGYYGYPGAYYGGFSPFFPGLSLSFGFRGGYYGGHHGGYYGGYHGGYRGGYHGRR